MSLFDALTPDDYTAFEREYSEWLELVQSQIPVEEPEEEDDEDDEGDYGDEYDIDPITEWDSAMGSLGWATDEYYGNAYDYADWGGGEC